MMNKNTNYIFELNTQVNKIQEQYACQQDL